MTPTTDLQKLLAEATKGPWMAIGTDPAEGVDCFWIKTQPNAFLRGFTKEIGSVNGSQNDPAQQANAALIAAAPALAAALLAERKAREVEVGALKRTMFTVRVIAVDALFQPTFQRTALERISAELRAALEGPTP